MRLQTLLEASETAFTLIQGSGTVDVRSIAIDSRKVAEGGLFVAMPGTRVKGSKFVPDALDRGALAILVSEQEAEEVAKVLPKEVALVSVPNIRQAAGAVAHAFFSRPSTKLKLIGITGTNGKTTCSYLIHSIIQQWGKSVGMSGTICQRLGSEELASSLTTPDCVEFHRFLKRAVDLGIEYVVTEVSSHALDQGRVEGSRFEVALFTNLTRDHLDYHKSLENYFQAKSLLFTDHYSKRAVINLDDSFGVKLWDLVSIPKCSYGQSKENLDVFPIEASLDREGIKARIRVDDDTEIEIESRLIGRHNLQNILAASAVAISLGVPPWAIKKGIEKAGCIPGRLEAVGTGDVTCLVDYAHTPDAVKNVLRALNEIKASGRIITVIGCGGDRDKGKRPEMAAISCEHSDLVVFTSDNPRTEDPGRIIDDMLQGVPRQLRQKVRIIEERKEAIFWACSQARKGDILLVAGKGHEDYQIIGDKRLPFDDRKVLSEALAQKEASCVTSNSGPYPILRNVCYATGGQCHSRYEFQSFKGVSTDTRTIKEGELFWALKGERFDGNLFVSQALEKGASSAVCQEFKKPIQDYPVALVKNDLQALGDFATWYKRFIGFHTLAITGSCGKTTTKDLIYSVISQGFSAGATKGNLNNLIGLPLTMLSMTPGTQWAILEMGTNLPGEIRRLCEIAQPKIGLITCVRPVHLEGLGSLENIGHEKGFLFQALPEDGCAIANLDDEIVLRNLERTKAKDIWGFGIECKCPENAKINHLVRVVSWQEGPSGLDIEFDADGNLVRVHSRLLGRANVSNVAAAFAAGKALGMSDDSIAAGIEACLPPKGRMNMEELAGWVIIDDSYNANPASMEAALEFFKGFKPDLGKNLVLGDMLELGEYSDSYHLQLGRTAADSGASVLVAVGEKAELLAQGAEEKGFPSGRIFKFKTSRDAGEFLLKEEGVFFNGTRRAVLLKGSRGVRLEDVAAVIKERLREGL